MRCLNSPLHIRLDFLGIRDQHLFCKASKAFRQLRDVFEDDLNQQGHVMVFGERLSFDLKLENGGLRDIPQDKYHQTGDAIGMARDREPLPLPKTTQTPSQEAPSGTETKPSRAPAKVEASSASAHKPTNDTPSGIPVRDSDREEDPLALQRIRLHL
jgi:hypothetical protein